MLKKQRIMAIEESLSQQEESKIVEKQRLVPEETPSGSSDLHTVEGAKTTADKSVQVQIRCQFRSKGVQTVINFVHKVMPPIKTSVSTSPLKMEHSETCGCSLTKPSKEILTLEPHSDSDTSSYTPSVTLPDTSAAINSLQSKDDSDCSVLIEEDQKQEASEILQHTLKKIRLNPRFYIGVPKSCYYLIDLIQKQTKIPEHHLLMCLKKIRLDSKFSELADDFSISLSYASKTFLKTIPVIASVMHPFIAVLDSQMTKQNLPMSFRHKYHNVACIIDCLEIEIQKPSKSLNQALTWSDYKKANTIKYLIACTPNGLVNYISPGYGGRITDTCLVESCDFLQSLSTGMCVMADRGFKNVEQYLNKVGVQLVRPPSVGLGDRLTKTEARQTKQIASLRIHVERVIRRVREFHMLKQHACINSNFVKVLDEAMIIACGLINLQDSIIK